MKKFIIIGCLLLSLISCSGPWSKEDYLKEYSHFIQKITLESDSYKIEQWKTTDEEYLTYSQKYYEKFKDDLTASEKSKIYLYGVKYQYYRNKKEYSGFLKDILGVTKEIMKLGASGTSILTNEAYKWGANELDKYNKGEYDQQIKELTDKAKQGSEEAMKKLEELINKK